MIKLNFTWVAKRFGRFAVHECRGSSPLYEQLSFHIAADEKLLCLASHARSGQPVPNLLFGAVRDLLLKGYEHGLREFYGSIVKEPRAQEAAFPYFRDFCLRYWEDIQDILVHRLVQTNEVQRCAYLYPVFCCIYEQVKKPLSLIEIGTSAGLQLAWDQYRYDYGWGGVHTEIWILMSLLHQSFVATNVHYCCRKARRSLNASVSICMSLT